MGKRYILVGGSYVGKGMFTSLEVVGEADTYHEATVVTAREYERCGGLLLWIDRITGKPGEPPEPEDTYDGSLEF